MEHAFGNKLSELLNEENLSQREFAKKVGITGATMSRYINNNMEPSGKNVARMAMVLHVTSDYLLGIDGSKDANWEDVRIEGHMFIGRCSNCGNKTYVIGDGLSRLKYCPYCGSNMRKVAKIEDE